jgi:hypothetical protein
MAAFVRPLIRRAQKRARACSENEARAGKTSSLAEARAMDGRVEPGHDERAVGLS